MCVCVCFQGVVSQEESVEIVELISIDMHEMEIVSLSPYIKSI